MRSVGDAILRNAPPPQDPADLPDDEPGGQGALRQNKHMIAVFFISF